MLPVVSEVEPFFPPAFPCIHGSQLSKKAYHRVVMNMSQISERLAGLREEMNELKTKNLQYWAKGQHTSLDRSAHALRQERLLMIKQELSEMKRCA